MEGTHDGVQHVDRGRWHRRGAGRPPTMSPSAYLEGRDSFAPKGRRVGRPRPRRLALPSSTDPGANLRQGCGAGRPRRCRPASDVGHETPHSRSTNRRPWLAPRPTRFRRSPTSGKSGPVTPLAYMALAPGNREWREHRGRPPCSSVRAPISRHRGTYAPRPTVVLQGANGPRTGVKDAGRAGVDGGEGGSRGRRPPRGVSSPPASELGARRAASMCLGHEPRQARAPGERCAGSHVPTATSRVVRARAGRTQPRVAGGGRGHRPSPATSRPPTTSAEGGRTGDGSRP